MPSGFRRTSDIEDNTGKRELCEELAGPGVRRSIVG